MSGCKENLRTRTDRFVILMAPFGLVEVSQPTGCASLPAPASARSRAGRRRCEGNKAMAFAERPLWNILAAAFYVGSVRETPTHKVLLLATIAAPSSSSECVLATERCSESRAPFCAAIRSPLRWVNGQSTGETGDDAAKGCLNPCESAHCPLSANQNRCRTSR
jgi:hypothetical protein